MMLRLDDNNEGNQLGFLPLVAGLAPKIFKVGKDLIGGALKKKQAGKPETSNLSPNKITPSGTTSSVPSVIQTVNFPNPTSISATKLKQENEKLVRENIRKDLYIFAGIAGGVATGFYLSKK